MVETVSAQADELKKLVASQREHAEAVNRLIDQKAFALADDPTLSSGAPDRETAPPTLDFAPMDAALARLKASAAAYDTAAAVPVSPQKAAKADAILQGAEQSLMDPQGLPGRPWYRHLIYAPGLLTGYGAKTLPGMREAIEARRWSEAGDYIGKTATVLTALSARLDQATAALTQ
jgi:N-acetylated-alpha-linked acidic dipeptidase